MVQDSKTLGLIGSVRVKVEYDKVSGDVDRGARWVSPIKASHHVIRVPIQQLYHVSLVNDFEEGEVEQDGRGARHLYGPVAGPACAVVVREVWGIHHGGGGGVVTPTGPHTCCGGKILSKGKESKCYHQTFLNVGHAAGITANILQQI